MKVIVGDFCSCGVTGCTSDADNNNAIKMRYVFAALWNRIKFLLF